MPADRRDAVDDLYRWKQMRAEGWELTVLHARHEHALIAFGWLPAAVQLHLPER